jgi:hypothetical protein
MTPFSVVATVALTSGCPQPHVPGAAAMLPQWQLSPQPHTYTASPFFSSDAAGALAAGASVARAAPARPPVKTSPTSAARSRLTM